MPSDPGFGRDDGGSSKALYCSTRLPENKRTPAAFVVPLKTTL